MAITAAEQKKLNDLLEEQKSLKEDLKNLSAEELENNEKYKKLLDEIAEIELKRDQSAKERYKLQKEDIATLETIAVLTGGINDLNDVLIEKEKSLVEFKENLIEEHTKEINLLTAQGELQGEAEVKRKKKIASLAKAIKNQSKLVEQKKQILELAEQQKEAHDGLAQGVADTVAGLTGSINASQTFAGKFMASAKHAGSIGGAMKLVKEGIVTALSPANVMAGLFAKIQEASMAAFFSMDEFRSELVKSGASLKQYGGLMNDVRDANVVAGVSMKDTQQSILALHSGMASFNKMTAADKKTLVATTAVMSKLGVDAQTSAGNLNILTKSMGMNAKEADVATREIAATANALGVSQAKMSADFAAAAPQLAAYGSEGVKVFRELSTQAKATGIEMSALLGITAQFDTFEGAAEAAGKLNAVLGTQINSIDLLMASDSERIKMLRDSVDASGRSWESMNKFERQMIASAAGIQDVNEAGKLFGTTAQQMDEAAGAAERMAIADKELQEQAANATTAKEKLTLIAERFGVAIMPLLNLVHGFLDIILSLNQALGGAFIPVMIVLIGLWWLSTAATKAKTAAALADMQMSIAKSTYDKLDTVYKTANTAAIQTNTLVTNQGILAKIRDRIASAARTVWTGISTVAMGAWGLAKSAINLLTNQGILLTLKDIALAPILLMWSGLKKVAAWLGFAAKTAETEATIASTAAEGASIPVKQASTAATKSAVGPMLAFGAAVLMVGAGVWLAAKGMTSFVEAFVKLPAEMIWGVVAALAVFSFTMLGLALIMSTVGTAAAGPMLAFGAAFLMIGAGVALAAMGLATFVEAFIKLKPGQIAGVVSGLATFGLVMMNLALIMATVGTAAVKPMLAFGAAFLMIGAGVALAGFGMATFVEAFNKLKPDQMDAVVRGIAAFGLTMALLGSIMLLAGPAMIGPMLAFGEAFLMMGSGNQRWWHSQCLSLWVP